MDSRTHEDNADDVIIIDDSFDGDIPDDETPTSIGKTQETGSEGPPKAGSCGPPGTETASGRSVESETAPGGSMESPGNAEKSLTKHAVTLTGQMKTVDQQQDNTDLASKKCQSSIPESIKTATMSRDACSEFSTALSGKEGDTHALAPEKSSESETFSNSLHSKSEQKSSDGFPVKCSTDNESTNDGVQNDRLVTVSSKELSSHQILSDPIGEHLASTNMKTFGYKSGQELTPANLAPANTNTSSNKSGQELTSSTQPPRYIIIRNQNTAAKQETTRKPGDKLTRLLQRLTSGKGGNYAVKLSTVTKQSSLSDATTQEEVNPSPVSGPSLGPLQDRPAVSQHSVPEISPQTSGKPTIKFTPISQEPIPVSQLSSQVDSSSKTNQSHSLLKAKTSKNIHIEKVNIPVTSSIRDAVQLLPQVQYVGQANKTHPVSTETGPAETSVKPGGQLFRVIRSVDDRKQTQDSPAAVGIPALIPADTIKYILGYLPVQGSRASNIVLAGPEGNNIQLGKASETYLQPSGVQRTARKSKLQFSLLQNPAGKSREFVQGTVSLQGKAMKLSPTVQERASLPGRAVKPSPNVQDSASLQGRAVKQSPTVKDSASLQGRVVKQSPTVRSLLTSSSTPVLSLKCKNVSASETNSAKASASLSSGAATMVSRDLIKPTVSGARKKKRPQTHTVQYKLSKPGQALLQPVSQPTVVATSGVTMATLSQPTVVATSGDLLSSAATVATLSQPYEFTTSGVTIATLSQPTAMSTSGNMPSSAVTTVTLSKAATSSTSSVPKAATSSTSSVPKAATSSTSSVPINRTCLVPISSTASGRPIFVMPTAMLGPSVPTVWTPSPGVNSKSLLAPGMVTFNNITAAPSQSDTLKTVFVPQTSETTPTVQSSANTAHSFSDLISRIALQSVPRTSGNKPSKDAKAGILALNLALQQIKQDLGDSATPVRIIVSQGSGLHPTAKLVYAQSQPSAVSQSCGINTQTGKKITVSKAVPKTVTVPDVSTKQVPKLIFPKPVSSDGVTALPLKTKSVSLLTMPLVGKNPTASVCRENAAMAAKNYLIRKDQMKNFKSTDSLIKDVKPKCNQMLESDSLKGVSTKNTDQKSNKVKASPPVAASNKTKNTVYTAILRTGQGPVSVRVVAPDMDEDSSDTMSDTGLSNVMLSEESVHAAKDPKGPASGVGIKSSQKWFENDLSDVICVEQPTNSDQEIHLSCGDPGFNTQVTESSTESVVSYHHHVQDSSGEETDSDTEGMTVEEQDISVLRQLLTKTNGTSVCDSETSQNAHQFSDSDLMSNAGNRPGNALSTGHGGMTQLSPDLENNNLVNEIDTEQDTDVESCELKIESIFSLRDPGDCQDTELLSDGQIYQDLADEETNILPVFNVRTSDDWKSFLNPCFVVLERLSKLEILFGGNVKTASKCSGHCRKRTLDYLCNLNLLRCVNHPDPFLFPKSKLKRGSVKQVMKKIIKPEVIKEMCVPEDKSHSSQKMKSVYVPQAADGSVVVMKTADLAEAMSEFFPVVKETYGKEDVAKSPSVVKKVSVKKDGGKSCSELKEIYLTEAMMEDIYVKRDPKLPSGVKATARKTMNNSAPRVKFSFVKDPVSIVSPKPSEAFTKTSISELYVKEAGVKETVRISSPVATELCGEDMIQFPQKLQETCVPGAMTKPLPHIKESVLSEDVVKSLPECSLLPANESQELPHQPPEIALASDAVLPAASSGNQIEPSSTPTSTPTAEEDQNDQVTDVDSGSSGPKSSKFNRALKQLQKQVNKKRLTMLNEKLNRKNHSGASKKQNGKRSKIKAVGQKRTNKVAVKKHRRKKLPKKMLLSTGVVKILDESKNAYKRRRAHAAEKLLIHSLPTLDQNISHDNSPESILPQHGDTCATDRPGAKHILDPKITNLSNVQNKNIKSKSQFVRLQPKVPGIPQEKIQTAIQSLNSYLAATGRKPTTGNTQFILLKIDDQHVLVKWPATSVSGTQQNSVPSIKIPVTSSADSTHTNIIREIKEQKQKEFVSTATGASFSSISNPVNTSPSANAASAVTANVNSTPTVTTPASNITTFITNIVKPNSDSSVLTSGSSKYVTGIGKKKFKIIRTKQVVTNSESLGKSSVCSTPKLAPMVSSKQLLSDVIMDASAAGLSNLTNSTATTGAVLNKQTFISLLKSGKLTQSHSDAVTAFVNGASLRASPTVSTAISSPAVSDSCGKAGSTGTSGSGKTGSKDTNITLSHLPPSSLLLPGRKRPSSILSEEERRTKRRRLEEKYPLPPGVVIKSEPDDLEDYFTSPPSGISPPASGISSAFTANSSSVPAHTESPEPFIMSGGDQVWSVENSVNIGSYLTDTDYPSQEHTQGQAVRDISAGSGDNSLSPEYCLNAQDSFDDQDEPPALLDETIDDDDAHIEDITNAQEDVPPVLQPMFTSSSTSLVNDEDIEELETAEFIPEMSAKVTTFVPHNRHIGRAKELSTSADSLSTTSLYSDSSMDSGVDSNCPSTSLSHTSNYGPLADKPVSKNLKIQYLKDLLRKKEMEIENMKRAQSELTPADFDI